MSWKDHDLFMQMSLVAWSFFKLQGYDGEYLFFLAEHHPLGCEISVVVQKPGLPRFSFKIGRAKYNNVEAHRRWRRICEEAAENDGAALEGPCLDAMLDLEISAKLGETAERMRELGLPTTAGEHPRGAPS